jgi:hypothetical protein
MDLFRKRRIKRTEVSSFTHSFRYCFEIYRSEHRHICVNYCKGHNHVTHLRYTKGNLDGTVLFTEVAVQTKALQRVRDSAAKLPSLTWHSHTSKLLLCR